MFEPNLVRVQMVGTMLDAVDPFAPSAQVQARSRQDYEADLKKLLAEGAALELEEARARRAAAEQGPKLLARASPSPSQFLPFQYHLNASFTHLSC